MITNVNAKKRVLNALRDLILIKSETTNLSDNQKDVLLASIRSLKIEYIRLDGADLNASYSDIADNLKSAKTKLEKIEKERIEFANALITATKILGSIRSVLLLVA